MSEAGAEARIENGKLKGAAFLANPHLRRVLEILHRDGEEARVVGGAVRNALLGQAVNDADIATTALPDEVMARAAAAGLRCIPTGIEHGTVTLAAGGELFEVTTLREDIDTDGRRAKVRFGRDFEADALRRDFTINALSADPDGRLYDYCDGLADIALRRVRFIGDPALRIREDYLRILRLFRFHAAYGEGALDREGLQASIAMRAGIENLSRERIHAELFKLLLARRAVDAAQDMLHAGILGPVLGGVASPMRLARFCAIEAAEGKAGDTMARLIALAVETSDDAPRLGERLRLSNAQERRAEHALRAVAALRSLTVTNDPPPPAELFRLLFLHGRQASLDAMGFMHAASRADVDASLWRAARAFLRDTPEPRLPFTGADLMQRGLQSGPAIGAALKRLQALWIRAGFPREPETLARLLDEAAGAGQAGKAGPG